MAISCSNSIASTHALVRPPGESFAKAISSTGARIDVALARQQHKEYCDALRTAGLRVESLPPDEANPDSCFMQDVALVVRAMGDLPAEGSAKAGARVRGSGYRAILCRMGAASRAGEPAAVVDRLKASFPVHPIVAPGTLEGGDVIITPGRLFVGETGRTNRAGIEQLAAIVGPVGFDVRSIPVTKYLHLLSAVAYVGRNTIVALPDYADHPAFAKPTAGRSAFDIITVDYEEAHAADALGVGNYVLIPAGNPKIARALRAREFKVLEIPLSAFAAADGGVTCLSLVW